MMADRIKPFLLPLVIVLAAEIAARATHLQSDALAAPSEVVAAFVESAADGTLLSATRDTLVSASVGLAVGGSIGFILGMALGLFPLFDHSMEVTIEAVRPIPSVALLPIGLIALGFGYLMEITIVAFACLWPLLIFTRAAVRNVEPRLLEVARALRLSAVARAAKIIIPAALPRIFVAFRLATGIALIVAVTVEIAANPLGLGAEIMAAQQALRPALMLALLVWISIVGFALNAGLILAQRRWFGRAAALGEEQ